MKEINSLEKKFEYLETLGFKTPEHTLIKVEEIPKLYQDVIEYRKEINYDIDGIVIVVDDVQKMKSLGYLNEKKKPKGSIALKFPTNIHITKTTDIVISFKGTQDIGLVAKIEPVMIDGTMVRKASLKSYRWVQENKVGVGSMVEVVKGGDIIPKIERVLTSSDIKFDIPVECPYCGGEILEGEAQLYCENHMCSAKVAARIAKFLKTIKVKNLAWKSLLKYAALGINLLHFVAKDWDEIEERIKKDKKISLVIWNKVRKQLEDL